MENYYKHLKKMSPFLLDQHVLEVTDQLLPFALSDVFTANIGVTQAPILHFWQLEKTVILGMKDSRVPHLEAALRPLFENDYAVLLRNSGGLGIVADTGVLNISFILPNTDKIKIDVTHAYQLITTIIRNSFSDFNHTITAKEISDSYCPGRFDLSIDNQKFAGIAQRRLKEGISVMIYLSVTGDQQYRGQLMRNFYQNGLKEAFGTNGYPAVRPESMANLNHLLQADLTLSAVKRRITTSFQALFETPLSELPLHDAALTDQLQQPLARMQERNDMIQDMKGGFDEFSL